MISVYSSCRPTFPSVVQAAFISSIAHTTIKSRICEINFASFPGRPVNFWWQIFLEEKRYSEAAQS